MKNKYLFIYLLLSILFTNAFSLPLKETLQHTLSANPEVNSLKNNTKANKFYIDEAFSGYLPSISVDYYLENKKSTSENTDTDSTTSAEQNGFNATIKYEQMIFDGGLTPSKVSEAKHNYKANKIENISKIENLLFDTLEVYLETVKYKEFAILSKNSIEIHEKYFVIAKDSEEVSGERLDRLEVESKLIDAKVQYIKEKRDANSKYETLLKFIGEDKKSLICRPIVDINSLESKEVLLKKALSSNYLITQELEKIKAHRALINQKRASFLPSINAKIQKEYDDDLDTEGIYKKELSARITLSYNLFAGLKDRSSYLQEKEFLFESQKTLDNQVRVVKEELNSEKEIYDSSLKRVKHLKEYVIILKEILLITSEQFEGGTKTFSDVLAAEKILYKAKKDLIEEEYLELLSYYKLLNIISNLSETIFNSDSQVCKTISADISEIKNSTSVEKEISELLKDESKIQKQKEQNNKVLENNKVQENNKKEVDSILSELLDEVYEVENLKKPNKFENKNLQNNKVDIQNNEDKIVKVKSDKKYYTITLLETKDIQKSLNRLKKRYSLNDDILKYTFTEKNKRLSKIAYGKYDTYNKALNYIKNLPLSLQKNKPYVSVLNEH